MGTLSSGQRDTESASSPNNQDNTEGTNGFISKITKKDSRSACNLRDTDDRSPYNDNPKAGRLLFRRRALSHSAESNTCFLIAETRYIIITV